jgi:hypothetical protein
MRPATAGAAAGDVELSARLFDFGVVSLRARLATPRRMRWSEFHAFAAAASFERTAARFQTSLRGLADRLKPAIERPELASVTEDYIVFRVTRLESENGERLKPDVLDDERHRRPARWRIAARHANGAARAAVAAVQLLSRTTSRCSPGTPRSSSSRCARTPTSSTCSSSRTRSCSSCATTTRCWTSSCLASIRRARPRARRFHFLGRRYSRLLGALQGRVADATEAVERAENAFKVTDDVFLARIYGAALEIFRERVWRAGIDRKVDILRKTYEMLNAEAQARRTEILELVVILLIALEIVLALRPH